MKKLKNVTGSPVTLSNLTSPSVGIETLTLGAGEQYDISNRELDFANNSDVLTNVRNGNLQVGNGGVFYSDANQGEVYLRSTFVGESFLTDGTAVVEFDPEVVTDSATGKSGTNLFMDILTLMRELYNDPGDPLYDSNFQKFIGTGGREEEHLDRTLNLENIHSSVGWHRREIWKYGKKNPLNLLIYYGYPNSFNSAINGWDNEKVSQDMAKYDLIALADGVEDPGHPDYANTQIIIPRVKSLNPRALIFGYVSTAQSLSNFQTKVDQWNTLQIHGIMMDESGYDYGDVSTNGREAFNTKVDYVHGKTYSNVCFVNSWNMDHIIGTTNDPSYPNSTWNPSLVASHLTSNDWYLLESFPINTVAYSGTGGYESASDWLYRGELAVSHRNTYGINLAAVGSIGNSNVSGQKLFNFHHISSLMFALDAAGTSDDSYGSGTAQVFFWSRPDSRSIGNYWSNSVNVIVDNSDSDVYYRFLEEATLILDFSSGAQFSSIQKFNSVGWNVVLKTANETRASTTTLTSDSDLRFAMRSGRVYCVRGRIFFNTAATPDFKFSITGPTATSIVVQRKSCVAAGTPAEVALDTALPGSTSLAGPAGNGYVEFTIIFDPTTSSDFFAFNWAQNTSNASNTTVLAGSYLEYLMH